MLQNPAYLSQFPSVERVKSEMKGSDDVDSYARFMAALDVINGFLMRDLLQAPNGGLYDMPPAADRVHDTYRNALTKYSIDSPEPPARDPRDRTLRDNYEKDPVFLDVVLTKFFSPQFRRRLLWMDQKADARNVGEGNGRGWLTRSVNSKSQSSKSRHDGLRSTARCAARSADLPG